MTIRLDAKTRTISGKKVFALRENGLVPGILYGHGSDNKQLELEYIPFTKVLAEAGENTIIDLYVDGQGPIKTLIGDTQEDPINGKVSHVDLKQIKMNEEITAKVELHFVGESKAVKEDLGALIRNFSELEIKCLPDDLIHEIKVDISKLDDFDKVIAIKDLNLSKDIEIVGHHDDEVVALVVKPKIETETSTAETATPADAETVTASAEPTEKTED